jgi:hypothetical protein
MHMVMLVFRSSLKERVHELLRHCHVHAFTEVNETVGYGQTGPAEGLSFYPEAARDRVAGAVKGWCEEHAQHPGWEKPSIRVFSWPCSQIA